MQSKTKWFEELRYGMFLHWGLYAIMGRDMWYYSDEEVPQAEYEKLFQRFNPVDYDPKTWAKICKNAGMKYAVLITKHHEGFCMWDTKQTDFNVMHTPFGRDIVREWTDAFRAEGIKIGYYFSIIDWRHPHYLIDWRHPQRAQKDELNKNRDFSVYLDFMNRQIEELMTQYGKIDIFWADFALADNKKTGEKGKSAKDYRSDEIIAKIRQWQPGILINNRFGRPGELESDFSTPEQYIPKADVKKADGAEAGDEVGGWGVGAGVSCWESCVTLGASWGYYRGETTIKPPKTVITSLVECVSRNGNLLLNVGPTPRGRIQPEFVEILGEVGKWLSLHGESVYGCGSSEVNLDAELSAPLIKALVTQREKDVYLHFIDFCPPHPFHVDTKGAEIDYVEFLSDKSDITFDRHRYRDQELYRIKMPMFLPDPYDTVVHIVLK